MDISVPINSSATVGNQSTESYLTPSEKPPLRKRILNQYLIPHSESEIKDLLRSKERWRKVSNVTEVFGVLFAASSGIVAYSAGFFNESFLSFIAGSLAIGGIFTSRFSVYAQNESKQREETLKHELDRFGINYKIYEENHAGDTLDQIGK